MRGQRQLRHLQQAQAADPRKPAAPSFRQGEGQGSPISRRNPCRLSWTKMFGPIRQQRSPQPRKNRRLSPLGGEPVDGVDKPTTCPPRPQEQKQKKRTFDALPKPAKLIRYRQRWRRNWPPPA